VAHAEYLREKARELRRERSLTIDELAERLALSRSTIYYWVRDLPIPGSGPGGGWSSNAAQRRGTLAMQSKYRRLREEAYAEGEAEFDRLAVDPSFRDFVCLYIAEGYKRNRNRVAVGNSDPAVVKVSDRWIRVFACGAPFYSLQYHVDQPLEALRAFWANELDTEGDQIKLLRKSNSNGLTGRTWRCRYGVLTVTADDTLFRARLEAWMDCLRRCWG
jgi:excisionase family DNA binding protein